MWGFPCGSEELVGGAGPFAQFDERIGLALRNRPGVGHTVGARAAGGELLDQRADHAAVLGVQPAFQGEAPIATVAQP